MRQRGETGVCLEQKSPSDKKRARASGVGRKEKTPMKKTVQTRLNQDTVEGATNVYEKASGKKEHKNTSKDSRKMV